VPKVKKKRVGFVIDMTPLVDITFLLLTFFMFTAKFKSEAESEQKFVIERPKSSADTSKIPEKDLAVIKVAFTDSTKVDTAYYYEMTTEKDWLAVREKSNSLTAEQKAKAQIRVTKDQLNEVVNSTYRINSKTKFAIDGDKGIRFKWISDAMDILRKNKFTSFNYVTDKVQ
jgi:biopolymer transport protein ExbD